VSDGESLGTVQFRAPEPSCELEVGPGSLAARSGEHRLMLAILEDAIAIFVKSVSGSAVNRNDAKAARAWLESRDRTLPFSFESICDLLGFDACYMRRGLWALRMAPAEAALRLAVRHHGGFSARSTASARPRAAVAAGVARANASA
jgi:hypothetical protein